MVEIFRAEGVHMDVEDFQAAEVAGRRRLHERVDEGSSGIEPELWREYFLELYTLSGVPARAVHGVTERVRQAHDADHLWTHALPGTASVLEALKAAGYRLGVVSNADGRMARALERAGVRAHFEFVIDSAVVGVEKPHSDIFRAGCDALGMAPEECLYVGDLYPVDYVGARGAGLEAVLLDPLGIHGDRAATVAALGELGEWLDERQGCARSGFDASHRA
jgi:HAD superfamily hydrolase (TIGR01549 family)